MLLGRAVALGQKISWSQKATRVAAWLLRYHPSVRRICKRLLRVLSTPLVVVTLVSAIYTVLFNDQVWQRFTPPPQLDQLDISIACISTSSLTQCFGVKHVATT